MKKTFFSFFAILLLTIENNAVNIELYPKENEKR